MRVVPASLPLGVGVLGVLGAVAGGTGCWRADVFAITAPPAMDGSVPDGAADRIPDGPADRIPDGPADRIPDGPADSVPDGPADSVPDGPADSVPDGPADGSAPDGDAKPVTCPSPALKPDDTRRTVKVGSLERSYVLHVPQSYDGTKPVPLILDFHKGGDSGSTELSDSPYPAVTDPEGVVIAFPDGKKGQASGATGWNLGPCCVENVDDLAFAKALVAQLRTTACIDPERIYAVGVGTGGGMAYYLACQAADVFAGVAPAAWDMLAESVGDCKPSRPITVISFRGTADSVVPYGGGISSVVPGMTITFLGAKESFDKWAEIDGCRGSPTGDNGCSTYGNCRDGVEVVLCTNPEGHQDPGNASVAWPLLKSHPLSM